MNETDKYSQTKTKEHPIAKEKRGGCVKLIDEIVKRGSKHKETKEIRCFDYETIKFEGAEAIDFDCITKGEHGCKSVDMVMILDNAKVLLVELKLCVETDFISKRIQEAKDQVVSSKERMKEDIDTSILIYCDKESLRDSLDNLEYELIYDKKHELKPLEPMTLQQFKQIYF